MARLASDIFIYVNERLRCRRMREAGPGRGPIWPDRCFTVQPGRRSLSRARSPTAIERSVGSPVLLSQQQQHQ